MLKFDWNGIVECFWFLVLHGLKLMISFLELKNPNNFSFQPGSRVLLYYNFRDIPAKVSRDLTKKIPYVLTGASYINLKIFFIRFFPPSEFWEIFQTINQFSSTSSLFDSVYCDISSLEISQECRNDLQKKVLITLFMSECKLIEG